MSLFPAIFYSIFPGESQNFPRGTGESKIRFSPGFPRGRFPGDHPYKKGRKTPPYPLSENKAVYLSGVPTVASF